MPNVYSGGRLAIAQVVGKYAAGPGDLSFSLKRWRDAIEYFGAPSSPSRNIFEYIKANLSVVENLSTILKVKLHR